MAALKWNGWQHSAGIGGSFGPEYAEKPIEALSKYESQIQEAENNLGLTAEQSVNPIHDRAMPMDEELKALLQDYRQSTLECLVDALIDQVI